MSQSTVVSVGNTPTANGGAWASHTFYDSVNNLYWAFTLTATSTTTLYTYSSPDSSTWTARATATLSVAPTDGRNLAVAYKAISGVAVVHVIYFDGTGGTSNAYHLRGTISGTTISWGSSVADSSLVSPGSILGVAVCLDSNNKPLDWFGGGNNGDVQAFYSANADTGSSWTTGMGSGTDAGVGTNNIASGCLIPLSNGNVVTLCDDGGGTTFPTASLKNVHAGKHSSSGFTASGSLASVFTALGTAQNTDTWNACYVSDTAVHVVLASGTNTWTEKLLNGSSTGNTTAPTVSAGATIPAQTFKATGGVAMIYNSNTATLYLFCIDSATGNDIRVISWTSGGGWGSWAGLGLASATRNYLSCAPQLDPNGNVQLYWVEGSASPYSLCTTQYATSAGWKVVQNPVVKVNSNSVVSASLTSGHPSVATTAGNSLIAVIWGYDFNAGSAAVSDSAGNTWTIDQHSYSTGASVAIASCHNAASVGTGGTFTVTLTGVASNQYWGFFVLEFAPPSGTGAYDTGANGTAGTSATPSSGASGTVAGGQELVVEAAGFWASSNSTSVSGWSTGASDGPITNISGASAFEEVTGSGTYTGNVISNSGTIQTNGAVAVVAVYKVTGGSTTLAGGATVEETATGTVVKPVALAGGATVEETASGSVRAVLRLAGGATVDETATGTVLKPVVLSGGASVDETAGGAVKSLTVLAGGATVDLTAAGGLKFVTNLAGTATVEETASGKVATILKLSGTASLDETATGTLKALTALTGTASVEDTATGTLRTIATLAGTATLEQTATGAILVVVKLTGLASEDLTASGALTTAALPIPAAPGGAVVAWAAGYTAALGQKAGYTGSLTGRASYTAALGQKAGYTGSLAQQPGYTGALSQKPGG